MRDEKRRQRHVEGADGKMRIEEDEIGVPCKSSCKEVREGGQVNGDVIEEGMKREGNRANI